MQSLVMAVVAVAMMVLGYFLYSSFLSKRVFKLSPDYETPSHKYQDGVDYVPSNKWVLWGYYFTWVAVAAPIVGLSVAVVWVWFRAFLWVTLGTFFFAGMHNLGALWTSARNKGRSIGTLSGRYIGGSGRILFL